MKHFSLLPVQEAHNIRTIFTDIDDTLTVEGKLTSESYAAIWSAYDHGIDVIPVTGRPAGWCDMIVRTWPVRGVVGENGAFYFYTSDGRVKERFLDTPEKRQENRNRLQRIRDMILKTVRGTALSKDQDYRQTDLAIDFREDVEDLGFHTAKTIRDIFEQNGAQAKISSIHVNGWFGDYNKLKTCTLFTREILNQNLNDPEVLTQSLFVGDSPNDEPMFEFFPLSVSIGDLSQYSGLIQHYPAYWIDNRDQKGFRNIVHAMIPSPGSFTDC